MRTPVEQQVLEAIGGARMVVPGDRVGVAVSGGADSVALLRLLENLRDALGISLLVVHFDHMLRGAESDAHAQFVAELARARGLEFIVAREDVAAAAARHRWNLEDAARRLRYAFFERVASEGRATRIAVAHTADDQAETVLAHVFRGTGPAGLAGIYPLTGAVVRPLLRTRRQDLRRYLEGLGQPWCEDSTNRDLSRQRARIREQLLPVLERDFSPRIVRHLTELSRFSREEQVFWTALVEDRVRALAEERDGKWTIRIPDLLSPLGVPGAEPLAGASQHGPSPAPFRALTERLVRRLYEGVRGDCRELGAVHVEQVIHLAADSSSGRRIELPDGVVAERIFDALVFSRAPRPARTLGAGKGADQTADQKGAYQYVLSLPDRGTAAVSVPELGSRFRLKVIDWPFAERDTKRQAQALDAGLLRNPLILRNWHPGDAYRPRGRRQPRKLKQMFLAKRIPSGERGSWPVLESGGRIIWARGMPPAEDFRARESTRLGVVIEEDRL
jgi:tRNA(Ile)-lysidine synthase